jgi:RHS repeat-associated protein
MSSAIHEYGCCDRNHRRCARGSPRCVRLDAYRRLVEASDHVGRSAHERRQEGRHVRPADSDKINLSGIRSVGDVHRELPHGWRNSLASARLVWVHGVCTNTQDMLTDCFDKKLDPATSLIEMGARPYDPQIGRFYSPDPVDGGSCNEYDYTCQDPVNAFDLTGLAWRWPGAAEVICALLKTCTQERPLPPSDIPGTTRGLPRPPIVGRPHPKPDPGNKPKPEPGPDKPGDKDGDDKDKDKSWRSPVFSSPRPIFVQPTLRTTIYIHPSVYMLWLR